LSCYRDRSLVDSLPKFEKRVATKHKRYIHKCDEKSTESTRCIKCGNKTASVCPYCFTDKVLEELKKLEVNKIILREFFEFFNYDFEHTGYSKEAEELGVI